MARGEALRDGGAGRGGGEGPGEDLEEGPDTATDYFESFETGMKKKTKYIL